MPYNWKCCSFYPNNFGASALMNADQSSSTLSCTCFHRPVETRTLASRNMSTGQWTTTDRRERNGPPPMVEPFVALPLIFIHKVG